MTIMDKHGIKIMLVDDHPIMRKGLHMIINAQEHMQVIGEAGSVTEAITITKEKMPDLIVLDLSLPDSSGIEFIREMKKYDPALKILVLTIHDDEDYLQEVLREGANGYLLKSVADEELIMAIRAAARGEVVLDPLLTKKILHRYVIPEMQTRPEKKASDVLSKRQKQILTLVAKGYTDKQIAEKIHVSVKTVESHKARIKEKLNISHRSDFVQYAMRNNLITLDNKV